MNPSPSDATDRQRVSVLRRGGDPATATSSAAEAAIRQILAERRATAKDRVSPAKQARQKRPVTRVSPTRRPNADPGRLPLIARRTCAAIVFGAICVAIVGSMVMTFRLSRGCRVHPLSGRLIVGKTIPAGAQVRLLPKSGTLPDRMVPRATVRSDGTFAFGTFAEQDGAPAGEYVAVVRWFRESANGAGKNVLPGRYACRETSPLSVTVADGPNAPLEVVIQR